MEGPHTWFSQPGLMLSDNDSGYDNMDDSLTDMQWLQQMDADSDIPGVQAVKKCSHVSKPVVMKESCRKKLDYCSVKKGNSNKPPLSYASLIALAICSTPQRMLTLSGIYKWIENTFPFYRTPEAKAWKNSIRHNLSIRKGMFMKVYQYPPRRGNGSYWTLLADGEDELKRAVPLFSTFQPPVIDPDSTYNRTPMTYTVKSLGQFVPVLPRSDGGTTSKPYFCAGTQVIPDASQEVVVLESSHGTKKRNITNTPKHLLDHSYAKNASDHLATGSPQIQPQYEGMPSLTPKRVKYSLKKSKRNSMLPHTNNKENVSQPAFKFISGVTTPTKDQDISLGFLESSLLTPIKDIVEDIEIGGPQGISLSPLYANFVSPKCDTSVNILPSPLSPIGFHTDSGIFTPFQRHSSTNPDTSYNNGTPFKLLSPLQINLLQPGTFSTPRQDLFPTLKMFDISPNSPNSSARLGSLQCLGLPGLTPPGPSCKK